MANMAFSLQKEDWSLHRKGHQDQERHRDKVKEAIKENLSDLVSEESIIMSDGKQIVKIPIRSLEEYRFRYNFNKNRQAGSGDGDSQVGDVIAKGRPDGQQPGAGPGAGDVPGQDYTEADVALEDIETVLFAELELPNLKPKAPEQVVTTDIDFRDVRKKGLMGNIDKKRTLLESIRRNQMEGRDKHRILPDDLRFKTWDDVTKPDSNAVVLALMDTSGSMGMFEKYCARTFFFWMTRFLKTKYDNVQIRYIAHHTEAREVSEEHFFTKGESGGTICSSAYDYALRLIDREYPPDRYNLYPIHFSDGDNLTSDNEKCLRLVTELCGIAQMFGYAEVNQYI
ncbi:sporulation protein YhbH [Alicyclobacillus cycloheptanicus]|uniref:Sporulation protein YhbH n=1 Tax=Alicyclobacillus cycloheptanicus TaxID=1457 RepID=A0ABT9XLV5_9BACL|nr:sporulation protein YhbH [Alicyclobacillus cycloheptanicus]MDQ0190728.1 sporulation protein YhbH [Alicyclobacillus cycloheptanicus]WDL99878.1 sporulation protein YhbH [Alicyclobacillus cycloheptanicus]